MAKSVALHKNDNVLTLHSRENQELLFPLEAFRSLAILLDLDGRVLDINTHTLNSYNLQKNDILTKNIAEVSRQYGLDLPIIANLSQNFILPETWKTVIEENGFHKVVTWAITPILANNNAVLLLQGYKNTNQQIDHTNSTFVQKMSQSCHALLSQIGTFLQNSAASKCTQKAINNNITASLQDLTQILPGEVYCNDLNDVYIFCNKIYEELYGLASYKDLLGKTAHFINGIMQQDHDSWDMRIPQYWEKNSLKVSQSKSPLIWYSDLQFKPYGIPRCISPYSSKYPIFDSCSNLIAIFGITVDGSNQQQIAELQKAYKILENQNIPTNNSLEMLTIRERECLEALAHGHTAKSAAIKLEISPRTIETHVNNMLAKTGCINRNKLIALFWQHHSN